MHLAVFFNGTGDTGNAFLHQTYPFLFYGTKDLKVMMVEGCHSPEVCNTSINPNLSRFARRFVDKLFVLKNGSLYLSSTQVHNLGIGVLPLDTLILAIIRSTPCFSDRFLDLKALSSLTNFMQESVKETAQVSIKQSLINKLVSLGGIQIVSHDLRQSIALLASNLIALTQISTIVASDIRPIKKIILLGYSRGAVTVF